MDNYSNVHINPMTGGANDAAIFRANTEATHLSNSAVKASKAGNHVEAAQLHQAALELKIAAFGESSVQAAMSYNGLAEALLALGRINEAETAFRKALAVRDDGRLGPRFDASVSREGMAQVYEVQGKWDEAKQIRLKEPKEMCCTNSECPGMMFERSKLKACSSCRSAFYCSIACQAKDWKARHKVLCRART